MTMRATTGRMPTGREEDIFFESSKGSYFTSLTLPVHKEWYDVQPNCKEWQVHVGQSIAVACTESTLPHLSFHKKNTQNKNPWYPFATPWAPAHVLALYKTPIKGQYHMVLQWLYWHNDAPEELMKVIPRVPNQVMEHHSKQTYDVNTALGRIHMSSSPVPRQQDVLDKDGIPQVLLSCQHAVVLQSDGTEAIEPLSDWKHGIFTISTLKRSLPLLEKEPSLQRETVEVMRAFSMLEDESSANDTSSESDGSNEAITIHQELSTETTMKREPKTTPSTVSDTMTMSSSASASNDEPEQDDSVLMEESDFGKHRSKRSSARSKKKLFANESAAPSRRDGNVLIDISDTSISGKRPSKRRSPRNSKLRVPSTSATTAETDGDVLMEDIDSSPSEKRQPKRRSARNLKRPAEETAGRATKSARGNDKMNVHQEAFHKALDGFVKDGSDEFKVACPVASVPSPNVESIASAMSNEKQDEAQIFLPTDLGPFHQDFAALRSYYSEIQVAPAYNTISVPIPPESKNERWTVKVGDVVTVRYRKGAGKTNFGSINDGNRHEHTPYKVAWALAEVVTIWKDHESTKAMKKSRSKVDTSPQDDVMIEIRWFYRKNELTGAAKKATVSEKAVLHVEYEEIFESDLMDECDAKILLGPVRLHESSTRLGPSIMLLGMPLIDVYCSRFWSIHRKSLLPSGDMSGRIARGRSYSKYFGAGGVLNAAWRELKGDESNEHEQEEGTDRSNDWKRSFKAVIENLGLTAASEDTSVRGTSLTGRDEEQKKIMTFLRSRISGTVYEHYGSEGNNAATNASLFVAGPPGTGKTASVLSVIARLRQEQATGKLPAFDFVSLNGMEMRHPFEAYVKFWEVISGPEKQKCPPEVAVAKLERYFAGHVRDVNEKKSKQVVVLLLDEIDYLVTKKQTVLYNFFDWPRRALENENGPKLIVVGISNTLNLPSRLKPSVQSRLGSETCAYKSYNVKDMTEILKTKILCKKANAYQVFDDDAIQFAARKTAALSGDIRKALHLCRAAAEAVMKDAEAETRVDPKQGRGGPIVRISDVQKASRESFSSILSKAVAGSTSFEALLLVSLASLTQSTGRHDGGFDVNELNTKVEAISGGSGDIQYSPPPTFGEILDILTRLGESRLVSLRTPKSSSVTFRAAQGGSGGAWPLISLPMDPSNLRKALRDTPHSDIAEKYITTY